MTTLIVVRHGQSLSNIRGTFTGQMDSPLTELGMEQAKKTAILLKDQPIRAIYSSDLERAMKTAEPTAILHGLEVVPDARLREICGGDWEGRVGEEIEKLYPENYRMWKTDIYRSVPDGGESVLDVAARVEDFIKEILARHQGECVAIFSHAAAVRVMACNWFHKTYPEIRDVPFCANASVSIIEYDEDGAPTPKLYGYSDHQGELVTHLSKGLA